MQVPARLVDHGVAHELVHLRHPDHSKAFWALMGDRRLVPLPASVTLELAMANLICADHLSLDLEARCVGCGERTGRRLLCPGCAEECRRADTAEHGHTLACYHADAALTQLCRGCRAVVKAMRPA